MKNYGINSQKIYLATLQGILACSEDNLQLTRLEKTAPLSERIKDVAQQITNTFVELIGEYERHSGQLIYTDDDSPLFLSVLTGMLTHPYNMKNCGSISRLCRTIIFTALELSANGKKKSLAEDFARFAHQWEKDASQR